MNKKKPNILFAIADDASHMSAYGHSFVQTPNFDQVAKDGILFNNAFATNPKCAPSRASILTGKHTWQLEEACNHFSLFPAKFSVFPDILEQAGYHIGFTGKGWAPGNWEKSGRKRNPAGNCYNQRKLIPPAGSKISNYDYTANFIDFLKQKPQDKPFYFWYGGREPHRKYIPGEGIRAGKNLNDISTIPGYWPDDVVVRSDLLDYAYETEWFDRHLGMMLSILKERRELENTLLVVTSDNGAPFPRIKGQMYEADFHLPLAISWPAFIRPGRKVDDLISFIDFAPTFFEVAGLEIPKDLPGKSLYNIFRSLDSGCIEQEREYVFMGKERHDLGRENDVGYPVRCIRTKKYLYVKNYRPDLWPAGNPETNFTNCDDSPTKSRILELANSKQSEYFDLCFGKRPAEELYNICSDPHCMNNLAEDKAFQKIKLKCSQRLKLEMKQTGDPRIYGNGSIFDSYPDFRTFKKTWQYYLRTKSNE